MGPKRKGRATKSKASTTIEEAKVQPTDEETRLREQVDLMVKNFDAEAKRIIKQSERDVKAVKSSIDKMFKLELMKMPKDTKNMLWTDYCKQFEGSNSALQLGEQVEAMLGDSVAQQVDQQLSAIKSTAKKSRMGGRAGAPLNDSTNTQETPVLSRRGIKGALATPLGQNIPPPSGGKTPMITPKFDTTISRTNNKTITRLAKDHNEILVSLNGSPVALGVKTGKSAVTVPLPGGLELNVPTQATEGTMGLELDDAQAASLEQLQKNIEHMLKMRSQATE